MRSKRNNRKHAHTHTDTHAHTQTGGLKDTTQPNMGHNTSRKEPKPTNTLRKNTRKTKHL